MRLASPNTLRDFAITTLLGLLCSGDVMAATSSASTLIPAIRNGDYATVSRLMKQRVDPNLPLPDGATALSWAVETQDARMVQLLLDAKAKPNVARNAGAAPLLLACEHGDPGIVALLMDAGADVTRSREDGVAALALCAATAPVAVLTRLADAGAEIDKADVNGQTALMWAAAKGRLDNLQLLLARGADVNRATANGFTTLFFALKSGHPEISAAVLQAGGDAGHVGPERTTAVQLAMYSKDYAFAARMIEDGADMVALDRNGHSLLQAAAIANQPALVKLLLAKGANPNQLTGAPRVEWHYEANFKSGDVVTPIKSPLLLAAEGGYAETMRLLADAGADVRFRWEGGSIVHAAVDSGHVAALDMALQLLPDANITDDNGQTPLHRLLRRESADGDVGALMQLLAHKGARTDIRNRRGKTPADIADIAIPAIKDAYFAAFSAPLSAYISGGQR